MRFHSARPNVWKGLAAGLVGGLVAAAAMSVFHGLTAKLLPQPSEPKDEDSTVKTASAISEGVFHRPLDDDAKKMAGPVVHFGFGAAMGGLYGASAELFPAVTTAAGLPFGIAVWLGAHVITVPALGLSKPPTQEPLSKEFAEFLAHLLYGFLADLVRRGIRKF
jgi:putative membrane protein